MSHKTKRTNHHQGETIDIHKILYPTIAEYTVFSSAHVTYAKIDHIMDHKTILRIFTKAETIQILSLTAIGTN